MIVRRSRLVSLSGWLALLLAAGCAPMLQGFGAPAPAGGRLGAELDAIFAEPALQHAHWGVLVRSLDTGETLYTRNADRLFLPASVQKLFTGAAALETLSTHYRYRTTIAAGGPIRNGVLEGPLLVSGTGDPTFSRRFHADGRDVFRSWADSLRAHGIRRVTGGVVAVDTAFVGPPLGSGWAWDDLAGGFAAEIGALQFNENVVRLEVFPSNREFTPAIVVLDPPTQHVRIINETRTMPLGTPTTVRIEREEAGPGIIVRGEVAREADAVIQNVAVRNPALYFAAALRETLREEGILVEGPAFRHADIDPSPAFGTAIQIFSWASPTMEELLPNMLKPSQNLISETLLRTVGREGRASGSAAAGLAVMDSLIRVWELPQPRFRLADGSGLSRYNLLSPALVVGLLERMDRSYYRDAWHASLPIAGVDGTLANRMRDSPLRERVRAKTGTLSNVRALSGYLTTAQGERIVFSVLVNGHVATVAEIDAVTEAALERIYSGR